MRGYKPLPRRIKEMDYLVVDTVTVTWSISKMNEERDATLEAAGNYHNHRQMDSRRIRR